MKGLPVRSFREGGLRVSGLREKTEGTSLERLGRGCQSLVEGSETAFLLEALRETQVQLTGHTGAVEGQGAGSGGKGLWAPDLAFPQ